MGGYDAEGRLGVAVVAHAAGKLRFLFRLQQGKPAHLAQVALKIVADGNAGQSVFRNGGQVAAEVDDGTVFVEILKGTGEGVIVGNKFPFLSMLKLGFHEFRAVFLGKGRVAIGGVTVLHVAKSFLLRGLSGPFP